MTARRAAAGTAAATAAAVGVAALALGAFLTLGGYDAGRALRALWEGSLGSPYALFSGTLVRATPLILAGLAVALAFRAGVLNVGAEGQLLAGAAAAAAAGVAWGPSLGRLTLVPVLAGGAAAGALWAAAPARLRRRHGVLEVISTIMMNFVALHAVGWLVRGPLQEPLRIYPQTAELPEAARMPRLDTLLPDALAPGTRLHAGFALAVATAIALWWVLRFTAAGFRVRAAGAGPEAAASAGLVDVGRTTGAAFLLSGALAGLAGAVEVTGVTYALYENISPGYGYTAIAVALLAGLHPLGVIATGTAFGALEAGAGAMQRDAAVPSVVVSAVEASAILVLLAAARLGAPGGLTLPRFGGRKPAADARG